MAVNLALLSTIICFILQNRDFHVGMFYFIFKRNSIFILIYFEGESIEKIFPSR